MQTQIKDFLDKKIEIQVNRLKELKNDEFGTLKWKEIWDEIKCLKKLRFTKEK